MPIVAGVVEKFSECFGTRVFITVFAVTRHGICSPTDREPHESVHTLAYRFEQPFQGRTISSDIYIYIDRLCGLVVRVLGYRSGGPGSIPGTIRKKKSSASGTGFTQPREYN
jgi:hypothetical protein